MGFFSNIGATIKDIYQKADVAVGGRLPGGVTRREVQLEKAKEAAPLPEVKEVGGLPTPRGEPSVVGLPKPAIALTEEDKQNYRDRGFTEGDIALVESGDITGAGGVKPVSASDIVTLITLGKGLLVKKAVITGVDATLAGLSRIGINIGKRQAIKKGIPRVASLIGRAPIKVSVVGGGIGVNAKTASLATSFAGRIAAQFKKPEFVAVALGVILYTAIKESRSGEVLGKFVGMEEAAQVVGMPKWLAYANAEEVGTPEAWALFEQARELENALYADQDMWDEVIAKIPWANALAGLEKFRAAGIASGIIWDKLAEMKKFQQENNLTESDMYAKARQEQFDMDLAVTNHFNEQRLITDKLIRDAKIDARNEDAAFWRNQKELDYKREAEERQAVADFWSEYNKQKAKLYEASKPSNLNFGLL